MADNRNVTGVAPAAGNAGDVAVDEAGGVAYQLMKLVDGTADSTTPIPGGTLGLLVQASGRQPANATGTLSASGQNVTATATGMNQVTFQLSGTYTGVTVVFESSVDGTNFGVFQVQQEDTGASMTGRALVNSTFYQFTGSLPAVASVRVRCTALGTGSVSVAMGLGGMPLESVVTIGNFSAGVGTPANVTASTSSTTLISANALRKGLIFYNDSAQACRVVLNASAASTTNFSHKLGPFSMWEVPFNYTGECRGIWETGASGAMRVTELTP